MSEAPLADMGGASAPFSLTPVHLGPSRFRLEVQGTEGALVLDWGIRQPGEGLLFAPRPGEFERIARGFEEDPYSDGPPQFAELARASSGVSRRARPPARHWRTASRVQRLVDLATESVAASARL